MNGKIARGLRKMAKQAVAEKRSDSKRDAVLIQQETRQLYQGLKRGYVIERKTFNNLK